MNKCILYEMIAISWQSFKKDMTEDLPILVFFLILFSVFGALYILFGEKAVIYIIAGLIVLGFLFSILVSIRGVYIRAKKECNE